MTRPTSMGLLFARGALLSLLALLAIGSVGCVQDHVLQETSAIKQRITVPFPLSTVGIRVNLVGSGKNYNRLQILGPFPASQDLGFCSVLGDFTIDTQKLDRHFIVARGENFDIGFGSVNIPSHGNTIDKLEIDLDSARFPSNDPRLIDSINQLVPKTAATGVFVLFAEDFGPLSQVKLVGDFNSFSKTNGVKTLYDDGSQFDIDPTTPGLQVSGDRVAGDGVWTLVDTTFGSFSGSTDGMKYGFIINDDGLIRRDPYEELSADRGGGVLASVLLIK